MYQIKQKKTLYDMTINETEFSNLIASIQPIMIVLECEDKEARVKISEHEIDSLNYTIFASFNLFESVTLIKSTFEHENICVSDGIIVSEAFFNILNKETDEEVFLTKDQTTELSAIITDYIVTV